MSAADLISSILAAIQVRIDNARKNELDHPLLAERSVAQIRRKAYETAKGDVERILADNWPEVVRSVVGDAREK